MLPVVSKKWSNKQLKNAYVSAKPFAQKLPKDADQVMLSLTR